MRRIGALILAAGGSTRFGEPKQLLSFLGKPLVRRIVDAVAEADCDPIVVVAGQAIDQIRDQLSDHKVLHNAQWQRGIGSSIKCGVTHLRDHVDAIVIVASDQPFVSAAIIKELIMRDAPIVASGYAGTLGIPALFAAQYFDALARLPDDSGAKSLLAEHRAALSIVPFPDGALDIDTRADYDRAIEKSGRSAGSFTFLKSS